jgi:hypothetical protein
MRKIAQILAIVVFILILVLFTVFLYEERSFTLQSRAQLSLISQENSFFFVTPTCALADGKQRARLTGFILNNTGRGTRNLLCDVRVRDYNMQIHTIQALSDEYGRVIFDLSTDNPGIYDIQIFCNDTLVSDSQRACFE